MRRAAVRGLSLCLIVTRQSLPNLSAFYVLQDELLGKIEDRCRRLGKEIPFGLRTASTEALRKHLEVLNSQIAARAQNNLK